NTGSHEKDEPPATQIMSDAFVLEMPLWEIAVRGLVVYLTTSAVIRLIPKRQTGDVSPNDLIALIIVGSLGADAIVGDTSSVLDMLLMIVEVLLLDYLFNLVEYKFPRFRRIAQDSPTLLIHDGQILKQNLAK